MGIPASTSFVFHDHDVLSNDRMATSIMICELGTDFKVYCKNRLHHLTWREEYNSPTSPKCLLVKDLCSEKTVWVSFIQTKNKKDIPACH